MKPIDSLGDVQMDQAIVTPVIIVNLLRRGDGTTESPIRLVTQCFSLAGFLLFEHDPIEHERRREETAASVREWVGRSNP